MRLIAVYGPLRGSVFTVDTELVLGRGTGNDIDLEDDLVSRRHCSLKAEDRGIVLRDLGSRNGTLLNDAPVSEAVLEHGDRITAGSSTFIWEARCEAGEAVPVFSREKRSRPMATVKVDRSRAIHPHTGQLQARILEHIFKTIPAKRAAVLLKAKDGDEFISGTYRQTAAVEGRAFTIDRAIPHTVLRDGLPILSNDNDSIICAPLIARGANVGVLYADTPDPAGLDTSHLELLMDIALIGGAALGEMGYVEWLESDRRRLTDESNLAHEMAGNSPAMEEVYRLMAKVAPSDSNVLILGESGTGKELAARAIHRSSLRKDAPFVAVNCGAIPETLRESELFGHDKGAFTGATSDRKGKIEMAGGGTLFLDELGELPAPLQAMLLRVIQQREFERVGGKRTLKANIRFVAATNRNLDEAVHKGLFRHDLLFRLRVITIRMPALRERIEDIPLLVTKFIAKYGSGNGVSGITPQALDLLKSYDWPGNVRELENVIERGAVIASSDLIQAEDLPQELTEGKLPGRMFDQVNNTKRLAAQRALHEAGGNKSEAARLLGISLRHLQRLLKNLGE